MPQSQPDASARAARLAALELLDSPVEPAFDRLTRLASRLLNAPVALVSLIDTDRQFFKSQVGLSEPIASSRETPLSHSFCKYVVNSGKPLIVDDARLHPLLADNPAIQDFNAIAYAGIPLEISTGEVLGSFCVIDTKTRDWSDEELSVLRDLTASVITEIELRAELLEHRRMEIKLQEQEQSYRIISELASDYCYAIRFVDGVEQLDWVAGAFFQITGYTSAEIKESGIDRLYFPDDMLLRMVERSELFDKGQCVGELRILTKDGQTRWLQMSSKLQRDDAGQPLMIYAAYKDITPRKLAEQERILSESKLNAIIQHTSDNVFLKDMDCRYLLANNAFASLFQVSADEIVGLNDIDLFGEVAGRAIQERDREVMSSRQSKTYEGTRLVHGVERLFLTTKSPYFSDSGEVVGLVGITRDISTRKEIENQLRQTIAKERHLNELKSRFVSMVSHEFRNPLATMHTSVHLLKEYSARLSPEKQLAKLTTIEQQIKRLTDLLDDILLIGKAEVASIDFCPMALDASVFCSAIVEEMEGLTTTHSIEFVVSGTPKNIHADPKLLRQILGNLLSNAVKYSPAANTVHLALEYHANDLVLRVRDEGIGIPEADLQQLFEVFHRGANVGKIPGTGLGMVIVQQAVETHGGQITCESELDKGTTFIVTLPYKGASN